VKHRSKKSFARHPQTTTRESLSPKGLVVPLDTSGMLRFLGIFAHFDASSRSLLPHFVTYLIGAWLGSPTNKLFVN